MVRLKHRYLVVLVTDTQKSKPAILKENSLYNAVQTAVKYAHGTYGDAAVYSGLNIKYINQNTGLVLIRCRRGPHTLLASALPLISECKTFKSDDSKMKISFTTLYTGACIKQSLLFIKRYQMDQYHNAAVTLSAEEREKLRETYLSCND